MNLSDRYRTNQLIKVEKENENLELKKRMKNAFKEQRPQRKETVWDRLSKTRKTPSSENVSTVINRSRQTLSTKPSHRFQIMRQLAEQQKQHHHALLQEEPERTSGHRSPPRPLTPNPHSNRNHHSTRKYHMQKAVILPEIDNQGFVYVCKPVKSVREIMSARTLTRSRSSLDDYKKKNLPTKAISPHSQSPRLKAMSPRKHVHDSSEDSADEFRLAPLMSSRSHFDLLNNSSAKIVSNFREILKHRGQSGLKPEELNMVKDVIKADQRYRHLDRQDPKLFKEILQTQLQDILKHEYAVKQALEKLECSENLEVDSKIQTFQAINQIVAYGQRPVEPQKLEVDVVFKNVPSLEKEIVILRALGEKLDATLKRSSSHRSLHLKSCESKTALCCPTKKKMFMKTESFRYGIETHARSSIIAKGVRLTSGLVQEFRIAQKTIGELKEDSNQLFYMNIDPAEDAELGRTSFKKLKQNPDVLMRHIKAKTDSVPFNILDQDPIFFNNIFFNKSQKNPNSSLDKKLPPLCEGGDSCLFYDVETEGTKLNRKGSLKESKFETQSVPLKVLEPPAVSGGHNRGRIRRSLTPLPSGKEISPKNNLFKTILVGSVQLSCFLLLIVAFTFPDAKC